MQIDKHDCFNRESDSVTVGAPLSPLVVDNCRCFNRESDSVTVGAWLAILPNAAERVSIAKAIPSLLERDIGDASQHGGCVSIAKAIPSLLEPLVDAPGAPAAGVSIAKAIPSLLEPATPVAIRRYPARFNRESDSVTVGAIYISH